MRLTGTQSMNERIRELRKHLKLTQQEFADRLGIPRNNIAGYETGKRSPSEAAIALICKEFGVNPDWIRSGKGDMLLKKPDNAFDYLINEYGLTRKEAVLIEKFAEMNDKSRQAILEYIASVAKDLQGE